MWRCALALLGFVSLLCYTCPPAEQDARVLVNAVSGSVACGNFSYWRLSYEGLLQLELRSETGDADIYVSEYERPSYEADRNNFSSATCGADSVMVSADFPRPFGIGVFGHWSHDTSDYVLSVYVQAGADKPAWPPAHEAQHILSKPGKNAQKRWVHTGEDERPGSARSQGVRSFLSMLDMLFDMFIL